MSEAGSRQRQCDLEYPNDRTKNGRGNNRARSFLIETSSRQAIWQPAPAGCSGIILNWRIGGILLEGINSILRGGFA
jgi:hypothetical protein